MGRLPLAAVAVVLTACSIPLASVAVSPSSEASPRVVEVTMTDAFRFEPDAFSFVTGDSVRFEVTNAGQIRHEFFIGDADAQAEHEAEMIQMGGMVHDEPNGISVEPGEMKVIEHVFDTPGSVLIGCHEGGHFDAGMRATVSVAD